MSRRQRLSKALNQATRGGRHKRLDVEEWLKRPRASCTREEAYVLIRQYHYEVHVGRWKRNLLVRILWALVLIVTFPLRLLWNAMRKNRLPARGEEGEQDGGAS